MIQRPGEHGYVSPYKFGSAEAAQAAGEADASAYEAFQVAERKRKTP